MDDIRCRGIAKSGKDLTVTINKRPENTPMKPVIENWKTWFDISYMQTDESQGNLA